MDIQRAHQKVLASFSQLVGLMARRGVVLNQTANAFGVVSCKRWFYMAWRDRGYRSLLRYTVELLRKVRHADATGQLAVDLTTQYVDVVLMMETLSDLCRERYGY